MIPVIADCPCDCAEIALLSPNFYRMLYRLEIRLGTPLFVSSAGRCENHNKSVGGSKTSKHIIKDCWVLAVDVFSINDSKSPVQIAQIAAKMGFKGIGIYNGHVHPDMRITGTWRWPDSLW